MAKLTSKQAKKLAQVMRDTDTEYKRVSQKLDSERVYDWNPDPRLREKRDASSAKSLAESKLIKSVLGELDSEFNKSSAEIYKRYGLSTDEILEITSRWRGEVCRGAGDW